MDPKYGCNKHLYGDGYNQKVQADFKNGKKSVPVEKNVLKPESTLEKNPKTE
ncbi:hypothetical protein SLS56_003840 [Neofusicoccum ribis]|uniref:Uncharacterized protein n=1 Tax=Neofusicoccum ribis TaxID=45134 RepID=A0ABR3SY36_9PEZI